MGFTSNAQIIPGLYTPGQPVASQDQLTSGKYLIYSYAKGDGRFLYPNSSFVANRGVEQIGENGIGSDYLYEVTVNDDNTFSISTYFDDAVFPIKGSDAEGKGNLDVSDAVAQDRVIARYNFVEVTDRGNAPADIPLFYISPSNATFGGDGQTQTFMGTNAFNDNGHSCYWSGTGTIGESHYSAFAFYPAEVVSGTEIAVNAESTYYLKLKETENSYLYLDNSASSMAQVSESEKTVVKFIPGSGSHRNKFAIQNIANNLYLSSDGAWTTTRNSSTPYYWQITTVDDGSITIAEQDDDTDLLGTQTDNTLWSDNYIGRLESSWSEPAKVKWSIEEVTTDLEGINREVYKSALDAFAGMVSAEEIEVAKTAIDNASFMAEINIQFSALAAKCVGVPVTIRNLRREGRPYLTYRTESGYANTVAQPNAYTTWILKSDNNSQLCLYNTKVNKYLSSDFVDPSSNNVYYNPFTDNVNKAMHIELICNTNETYPGISFHFISYSGNWNLRVDAESSDAVMYGWANDGGSSWALSFAGVYADQIDTTGSKYYRIRSARGIDKDVNKALIGVASEEIFSGNKSQYLVDGVEDCLGALWTIHAADQDGNVYIRNAAARFNGSDAAYGITGTDPTYAARQSCVVSSSPHPVKILTAKGAYKSDFASNSYGLAILTSDSPLYMDNSDVTPKFNGWDKVNNDFPNNVGVYYFEEAYDAEELVDDYIQSKKQYLNSDAMAASFDVLGLIPELWSADDVAAAKGAYNAYKEDNAGKEISSVEETNEVIQNAVNIYFDLTAKADGKTIQFENAFRNDHGGHFMTHGDVTYGGQSETNVAYSTDEANSLKTLWTLVNNPENGKFKLKNFYSGEYIQDTDAGETSLQMVSADQASEFWLEPVDGCSNDNVEGTVLQIRGISSCLHEHNDNENSSRIVKWGSATTSGASGWNVSALVDAKVSVEKADDAYEFKLGEGVSVNDHETASELTLTITKKAGDAVATSVVESENGVYTIKASEFNGSTIANLSEGEYTLEAPISFFMVNGKHSAPINTTFVVTADGTTLAIDEIASDIAEHQIYDLQGRKVSSAVRGLYIVNGKKVLVK